MKKLLLAAAVATLSINAVQAAPTLYGKLNVSINQVDNKNFDGKSDVTEVNSNSSRIGVKGEEKLTDKLSAVYLAEWAISTDGSGSDTDLSARNRFIGLKTEGVGTLKVGKYDSYFKTAAGGNQDIFNDDTRLDITNIMYGENRLDNVIGFELDPKLLAGLTFNIMAQTGESTSDSKPGETGKDSKNDSFDSVSTSLGYENKDIGLAIAAAGDFGIKGKYAAYGLKDVYTDAYRVTGSYDIAKSGFVVGALWQHAEPTDDLTAYKTSKITRVDGVDKTTDTYTNYKGLEEEAYAVTAAYKIPNTKLKVKAEYASAETQVSGKQDRKIDLYGLGLDYQINKQARFYGIVAQQKRDWIKEDDKQTVVGTGIEYNF